MRRCPKFCHWTPGSLTAVAAGFAACLIGCFGAEEETVIVPAGGGDPLRAADLPVFSLAWSEYPSWSVFGVAEEEGLLNGEEGALGEMEEKWRVDVVLRQADYDTCLGQYANASVDAVCITNMDLLTLAPERPATVVLPTSTSEGGDAILAVGADSLEDLKGVETRGLGRSVSQYVFERALQERGLNPADYPFADMPPDAAALGMQNGDLKSIVVWNPFLLSTERKTPGAKRLFSTEEIPEEVIDLVAVANASLAKPGGPEFAACLADTFHVFNERLAGPDRDDLLVALGEKFSRLPKEDMELVVTQTRFYDTADAANTLLADDTFRDVTTPRVSKFALDSGMVDAAPKVGFDDEAADVNFTGRYIAMVAQGTSE